MYILMILLLMIVLLLVTQPKIHSQAHHQISMAVSEKYKWSSLQVVIILLQHEHWEVMELLKDGYLILIFRLELLHAQINYLKLLIFTNLLMRMW